MDQARPAMTGAPSLKPMIRSNRRLSAALAAVAVVGAGAAYVQVMAGAEAMRQNDAAQKGSEQGGRYVSVDRSGGGI